MAKNVTETKTETAPAPAATTPKIPAFRDKDGILLELSKSAFPKSKEGKIAFFDYQIEKIQDKKKALTAPPDKKAKAAQKMARLKAQLEKLEKEMAAATE